MMIVITIAGVVCGGLGLALLLGGWFTLAPWPLMIGGALYVVAGIAGIITSRRTNEKPRTG